MKFIKYFQNFFEGLPTGFFDLTVGSGPLQSSFAGNVVLEEDAEELQDHHPSCVEWRVHPQVGLM